MGRTTLKDIAQRLDIAPGTVSRALNDKPGISKAMKQKVNAMAEEMGYVANNLAKGLSRKPIVIGILLPSLRKEYYEVVRRGIERALTRYRDYKVDTVYRFVDHLFDWSELTTRVHELIDAEIDIAIVTAMPSPEFRKALNLFVRKNIGVVLLGDSVPEFEHVACERIDGIHSGMLAGEFADLVIHQSRKVAIFLGYRSLPEHEAKRVGFCQTLEEKDITVVDALETYDNGDIATLVTYNLLNQCPDLELIYVASSNCVAVCKALDELDPQKRIKVIATDIFEEMVPYVQSGRIVGMIYQNLEGLGIHAVDHACEYVLGGKKSTEDTMIQPLLVLGCMIQEYL